MDYGHFGKEYNGEKAIISLTSWKARINTVGLTIFSLLKQCPGFHIVLVLSEEEFPAKETELPAPLQLLASKNLIEILWVVKNYKSFKKVLFTMDKYNTVPIISADDDCIYVCNYAEELYNKWLLDPQRPVAYRKSNHKYCLCGPASIYPPSLYKELFNKFMQTYTGSPHDDDFVLCFLRDKNITPAHISTKFPCYFHDEIHPINGSQKNTRWINDQRFV